jgi:hypothetical protein
MCKISQKYFVNTSDTGLLQSSVFVIKVGGNCIGLTSLYMLYGIEGEDDCDKPIYEDLEEIVTAVLRHYLNICLERLRGPQDNQTLV